MLSLGPIPKWPGRQGHGGSWQSLQITCRKGLGEVPPKGIEETIQKEEGVLGQPNV